MLTDFPKTAFKACRATSSEGRSNSSKEMLQTSWKKTLHLFQELWACVSMCCYCKIATKLTNGSGNPLSQENRDVSAKKPAQEVLSSCRLKPDEHPGSTGAWNAATASKGFPAGAVVWVHVCHWDELAVPSARRGRVCLFWAPSVSQLHYLMLPPQPLWRHWCPSSTLRGR